MHIVHFFMKIGYCTASPIATSFHTLYLVVLHALLSALLTHQKAEVIELGTIDNGS